MTAKSFKAIVAGIAVLAVSSGILAQEEDNEDAEDIAARTPTPPPIVFKYSASQDPLQALQEIAAANDEILRKQQVCLSALAQLEEKAKAGRASAARSTSKGKKKP